MAGIGFELKKLFRRKGLFATLRAYGHAGVICTGPMLLCVLLQVGMLVLCGWAGAARADLVAHLSLPHGVHVFRQPDHRPGDSPVIAQHDEQKHQHRAAHRKDEHEQIPAPAAQILHDHAVNAVGKLHGGRGGGGAQQLVGAECADGNRKRRMVGFGRAGHGVAARIVEHALVARHTQRHAAVAVHPCPQRIQIGAAHLVARDVLLELRHAGFAAQLHVLGRERHIIYEQPAAHAHGQKQPDRRRNAAQQRACKLRPQRHKNLTAHSGSPPPTRCAAAWGAPDPARAFCAA